MNSISQLKATLTNEDFCDFCKSRYALLRLIIIHSENTLTKFVSNDSSASLKLINNKELNLIKKNFLYHTLLIELHLRSNQSKMRVAYSEAKLICI